MAMADYYHCDICGCKTFYDAELSYTVNTDEKGRESWANPNPRDKWRPMPDGNVGDMMVICKECTKNYEIKLVKRATKHS